MEMESKSDLDIKMFVPEYEYDTESNTESEEVVAEKKTRVCLEWDFVEKFNNHEEAEKFVETEGTWALHYCHVTEDGKKKYYRCNKLKRRGPQCSAKMYLLYENTSDSVLLFKTNNVHDHESKKEFASTYGLTENLKSEINKMFDLKLKPKAIMRRLMKMENVQIPKMSQLRNYLNERRRAVYGQSSISLGKFVAKSIPVGQKRKRGRPPKAKQALIVQ